MSEIKITGIFAGAALFLAVVAFAFSPGRITPEAFMDQGEVFFPDFTDPNVATTLEVIEYDEEAGRARPFKVTFLNGRWTIPSHHDYPADGQDRLAQTAAGVIDIKKDDYRTNVVADHEACGVIDPLDETVPGLTGRGSRISLKGEGGETLAEFIVGKPVPGREGFHFVRLPDQNRVYASRMNLDISTNFADWIETNLLEVQSAQIESLVLDNYSINERSGSIVPGEKIDLLYRDEVWTSPLFSKTADLDTAKVRSLARALEELTIVGVRPKPEGLSASLKGSSGSVEMTQSDRRSLQGKGFYLARSDGRLLSNEGEIKVHTTDGLSYILRFGEVLYGSGLTVTAGQTSDEQTIQQGQAANRYLFVTTEFNDRYFREPAQSSSLEFQEKADSLWTDFDKDCKEQYDKHQEWERKVNSVRRVSESLNARFADWYYVISEESFKKIHLSRAELRTQETES